MAETAAERFAIAYSSLSFDRLPAWLIADLGQLLLDYLGVAVAGSNTGSGRITARFAVETGGVAEARLIGHGERVPAAMAAFCNAISSHSIELDDVDSLAYFHFSPPVYSAALAVAERVGATGEQFVTAVAAGCDMLARLSAALNPSHRDRGFHTTASCGVFGAAVAACRLLGLDADRTVAALGLAGAQASGLMEMYGPSMQKRFNPGPAARNGVVAAELAARGFTGAATILDGPRGFFHGFSDACDTGKLFEGLGESFPIEIEYKAHSCARPIHNAIDCALNVRDAVGADLGRIERLRMRRHPDWAHFHLNAEPKTYHEAQVSLPYSVAVALKDGVALLPQYSDSRLAEPDLLRLSRMLVVDVDPALPRGVSCVLDVHMRDGTVHSSQVDYPRGSSGNPVDYAGTARKFRSLAEGAIGAANADALVALCNEVAGLPRISTVVDHAVTGL